jgi:hypothetical protein
VYVTFSRVVKAMSVSVNESMISFTRLQNAFATTFVSSANLISAFDLSELVLEREGRGEELCLCFLFVQFCAAAHQ